MNVSVLATVLALMVAADRKLAVSSSAALPLSMAIGDSTLPPTAGAASGVAGHGTADGSPRFAHLSCNCHNCPLDQHAAALAWPATDQSNPGHSIHGQPGSTRVLTHGHLSRARSHCRTTE